MRFIREVTSKEENFRVEPLTTTPEVIAKMVRRDFVEPEPVGTIVLFPFRITGYGRDCDGSALAKVEALDNDFHTTGWTENCIGLYPSVGLVVTEEEYKKMVDGVKTKKIADFLNSPEGKNKLSNSFHDILKDSRTRHEIQRESRTDLVSLMHDSLNDRDKS